MTQYKPKSYAERHPERMRIAAQKNCPHMVEMLHHFPTQLAAAEALGYDTSGPFHTLAVPDVTVVPAARPERRAAQWVREKLANKLTAPAPAPASTPVPIPAPDIAAPVAPAPEPTAPEGDMLLVVCPPEKREKVTRMLSLMGCEVEAL